MENVAAKKNNETPSLFDDKSVLKTDAKQVAKKTFEITQKDMMGALSCVMHIVPKKTSIHNLQHILIESCKAKGEIKITATNLQSSIIHKVKATVFLDARFILFAKTLTEIISSFESKSIITMLHDDKKAIIKSGKSRFKLMSIEDFPDIKVPQTEFGYEIESAHLLQMIDNTIFCTMQNESSGHTLNSVCIQLDEKSNDKIRCVATDSHRLSISGKDIKSGTGIESAKSGVLSQIIVSKANADQIMKIIAAKKDSGKSAKDKHVLCSFSKSQGVIEYDDVYFLFRMIEGVFPGYAKIMLNEAPYNMMVDSKEFFASIKRVKSVTSQIDKLIEMKISGSKIEFIAKSSQFGDAEDTIEIGQNNIKDHTVSFYMNCDYLMDLGTRIKEKDMAILFNNEKSPIFFNYDKSNQFVIMPIANENV